MARRIAEADDCCRRMLRAGVGSQGDKEQERGGRQADHIRYDPEGR